MLKLYFKQAWALIKQNRLFSGMYIFGTALAIASATIMAVVIYIDIAPIYPDANRANVYYFDISSFKPKTDNKGRYVSAYSYKAVNEWFYTLKNAKVVSAECASREGNIIIKRDNRSCEFKGIYTDVNFFDVYNYRFIEGRPFTKSDFDGELNKAVISDKTAQALYGSKTGAVGKTVKIGPKDYTVCGVIEEPSVLAGESYANIIMPYTTSEGYRFELNKNAYVGHYTLRFVVEGKEQAEALRAELVNVFNRFSNSDPDWEIDFSYLTLRSAMRQSKDLEGWVEFHKTLAGTLLIVGVFILLLIPSLNLSGMISSRMEMRKLEMGVRKSFGATRSSLLKQVMWENLFLTILGGFVGLVLCWLIIFCFKEVLFSAYASEGTILKGEDIRITAEMVLAPAVFLFSFGACVVLNVMSAYIPARRALRFPIVESLNFKK